ncbi:hypothetical protein LSUB1_G001259 [Lachnellula subtilissima]|uniref:Ubiquinol-cytochrome-c reductase cytochrome c1 n=1 Tax=Lachnellula subtilissima TaxID=602034 RepID=A0A8H8S1P3_9HELO|nr:hypothetical protein LSUB1_G001259 [Lachnellula subtilissima]
MSSDATMPDLDLDKQLVYLAYRDIFKDKLAKLRKRSKVRNVVEKHKDHLHHMQLADSTDSEKICRILGDLLAARLFESESMAKATFPTLFSHRESGNDTALIVKCVDDDFDRECGQRVGENPDALPSLVIHMPKGASLESAPPVIQHRIDRKSGRVRKPTRATTNPTGAILQVGKTVPKEAFLEDIEISLPNHPSRSITPTTTIFADREKGRKVLKRKRDSDITPTNPTYLPSRLQHLILTQTQRLLEECCYTFAEKWFPSMLEANGWDAPEAVELSKWWMALSKCDIPPIAVTLSQGQSLAGLFRRAISIRHCAVHRRPQIPVNKVEEMIRDAWLLSQALQDDLRATQLLHWCKELESLVEHLELRTNSQREAAEAELRNIQNAKVETEERLAKLELRAGQLTQSLKAEGRTHQPIDVEALRHLEEALRRPALTETLSVIAQDQVWQWIESSLGTITILKRAANRTFSQGMSRYS